eukprot:scaffold2408_cov386-Prasinococcus_capsulatus_cf.AAC.12
MDGRAAGRERSLHSMGCQASPPRSAARRRRHHHLRSAGAPFRQSHGAWAACGVIFVHRTVAAAATAGSAWSPGPSSAARLGALRPEARTHAPLVRAAGNAPPRQVDSGEPLHPAAVLPRWRCGSLRRRGPTNTGCGEAPTTRQEQRSAGRRPSGRERPKASMWAARHLHGLQGVVDDVPDSCFTTPSLHAEFVDGRSVQVAVTLDVSEGCYIYGPRDCTVGQLRLQPTSRTCFAEHELSFDRRQVEDAPQCFSYTALRMLGAQGAAEGEHVQFATDDAGYTYPAPELETLTSPVETLVTKYFGRVVRCPPRIDPPPVDVAMS